MTASTLTTDILIAVVYPVIAFFAGWWLGKTTRPKRTPLPPPPPRVGSPDKVGERVIVEPIDTHTKAHDH